MMVNKRLDTSLPQALLLNSSTLVGLGDELTENYNYG
jgi:hypothetical protein